MANISLDELNNVLQKSGLPFGNALAMEQATPFAQQPIQQQVYSQDTKLPQIQASYKSKLDAIAKMDQQLAGVYGDPSSSLYIEHAGQREKAIAGPSRQGYSQLEDIGQAETSRRKELDQQADEALNFYKKLATLQDKEEKRVAKLTKGSGKAKKSIEDKVRDSNERKAEVERQRLEMAGIQNKEAADIFLNAPKAFQEQFIRDYYVMGGPEKLPADFSPNWVKQALKEWEQSLKGGKGKSSSGGGSFQDKVKTLLEQRTQ